MILAPSTAVRSRSGEVILLGFLATVAMLFAGFTAAYLIRRAGRDWTPIEVPPMAWWNLGVLAIASGAAELACRRGARWIAAALVLGAAFLGGQWAVWRNLAGQGILLTTAPQGSFFCMLSGVHALHALGGIGAFLYAWATGGGCRLAANYWHFLGFVWLYVLLLVSFV